MLLNEYQVAAAKTAIYEHTLPAKAERIAYCALGLAGEAGEVANIVKKPLRSDGIDGLVRVARPSIVRDRVLDELGDVLWYVANLARECGLTLEDVAEHNLTKLEGRHGG